MLNSQLILFCYMAAGIYAKKKNIIDDNIKNRLIDIVLEITLPCMIFHSFNKPLTMDIIQKTAMVFFVSISVAMISYILGKLIYRRYPHEKKIILQYATLVNNAGFLGMPLVANVFGSEGILYAAIFTIPNRIMMWTAGLSLFTNANLKESTKKILLNPCIITVYLGILRCLLNIPFPEFLDTAIANIGAMTSPLSIMIIGTMLVGVEWKIFWDPSIFYLSFIRLLALPMAALFILKIMHADSIITGVSLILTGMPAGATSALLAAKYGADNEFASACVVTTTLLSLVTAPLLMLLL